jgi:hypothetical protein
MTPSPVTGLAGKLRNPIAVWLLAPLTLGIYGLVWYYKANRETRDMGVTANPGTSVLAITLGAFILVPPFVSIYKTGERIAQAQLAAGMPQTCNPALVLILWIFVFGTGPLYYQGELNKIWARYGNPPAGTQIPVAPIQQAVGYQPQGYQPQGYPTGDQAALPGQPQGYYPAGGQVAPPS